MYCMEEIRNNKKKKHDFGEQNQKINKSYMLFSVIYTIGVHSVNLCSTLRNTKSVYVMQKMQLKITQYV